jgi:hypothetical protein
VPRARSTAPRLAGWETKSRPRAPAPAKRGLEGGRSFRRGPRSSRQTHGIDMYKYIFGRIFCLNGRRPYCGGAVSNIQQARCLRSGRWFPRSYHPTVLSSAPLRLHRHTYLQVLKSVDGLLLVHLKHKRPTPQQKLYHGAKWGSRCVVIFTHKHKHTQIYANRHKTIVEDLAMFFTHKQNKRTQT